MKLVQPIAKSVCKIIKLSLHFFKLILPKEYMYTCGQSVDKILGLEFCLNFDLSELHYTQEFKLPSPTNTRWGEPTYTLVSWMQGFRHPTRNEYMGWFAQIAYDEALDPPSWLRINTRLFRTNKHS
jgi:hypothetical protein